MNRFKKHIPPFVDVDILPDWIEFETTEDLLKIKDVEIYNEIKDFSHFAVEEDCLLAISDEGFHWWVIGFIEKPEEVNLPKWEGWKFYVEFPNGEKKIVGDGIVGYEVRSSCGDYVTFRNGKTAKICKRDKF